MPFSDQEIQEFKAEAFELLEIAEKSLLSLDQGGEFRSAFDAIFRCFHNLKGASGMMEMTTLQTHTHELENILMPFKTQTTMPSEYISFFLRGVDAARAILNGQEVQFNYKVEASASTAPAPAASAKSNSVAIPDAAMSEFFAECDEIVDRVSDALQRLEKKTHSKETIESLYRDIHSLKGSAYLFQFNALGTIAHAMESALEGVRSGKQNPTEALVNALFNCLKVIEAEVQGIKTNQGSGATEALVPELTRALNEALGGAVVTPPPVAATVVPAPPKPEAVKAAPQPVPVATPAPVAAPAPAQAEAAHGEAAHGKDKDSEANSTIRVSVSLLDNLMTLMGEMVLVRNQVIQFSSKSDSIEFLNLSKRLNVVTSEIQGEMMKTRMQPIGNILSKFSRVVRDLSHDLKKEIALHLVGAETEMDKSLLEAIKDPLTHIVRNSCDHGVELPDVRAQAGKSRAGNITIRSYHEGGQVVIEVADDGKGLHKDVILKKALEKSLINQSQASSMSEKDIFNLIFAPGFSTAAAITNVSGRGVGMDVVRTNVERIGGSVDLTSVAGKGTTIKIKIPLTLAIVPALIVRHGPEAFAIPQVKLEELVRVDNSSERKIEYIHGAPVFRLRGNILPLVSLGKILGMTDSDQISDGVKTIAVLSADQFSFGLIVDEVRDTADIVVKPINRLLKSLQVYSGATILGDGSIALVLDVVGISKLAEISSETTNLVHAQKEKREGDKRGDSQDYLLVRVNSKTKHAIVLNYVNRLEEFKANTVELSGTRRVVRYGDSILPLLSIDEALGLGAPVLEKPKEILNVVVVQKAGVLYGLEVDEILDTFATNVEPDNSLGKQPGIFGNLNTPKELIVVIDPFELIIGAFPEAVVKPAQSDIIPLAKPSPSSNGAANGVAHANGHAAAVPQKLNVLLVEDAVFFQKTIKKVLLKAGHDVTVAMDGKEALEILEKDGAKFDIVVSDIEMPRMNGFELAKAVRSNQALASLPMLALSSRAEKDFMDQGLRAGFNIYLEKLKPDVLLDAVSTLLMNFRRGA